MVTSQVREGSGTQQNGLRGQQRVATPAIVIGLGSTSCHITRRLEELTVDWGTADRKSLGFLYLDTREATRAEIAKTARFIPMTLPHFSHLRDLRPWITECVPELKLLSLSREGALGMLANAGVAARFNYGSIKDTWMR